MVMMLFFLAVSLMLIASAFGAVMLMMSGSPFSWSYCALSSVFGMFPLFVVMVVSWFPVSSLMVMLAWLLVFPVMVLVFSVQLMVSLMVVVVPGGIVSFQFLVSRFPVVSW